MHRTAGCLLMIVVVVAVAAAPAVASATSSGPGYSDATRLTVTLRDGRATGRVTYTATGRSAIANKDCTGRLDFTAQRR
jgi:hypothetical protein